MAPLSPPELSALTDAAMASKARGPAPVHRWNPPFCGAIDMRIAADGTWHYNGSPIGRPALVRLFSSILRKDPEGFMLVTPAERVAISVEDAPFIATTLTRQESAEGPVLILGTNVEDEVRLGPDHPLRFEEEPGGGLRPYVLVRGGLWAKVARPVYYELVALGEERPVDGRAMFGIASGPAFFPMIEASALADL
jgi:hypothetical protein